LTHLSRQGFRSFLPRYLKTVRHARKLRTVNAPIFPRYLFVALNLERDRWRSVNGTTGITNLFMAHDRPVPVPDGIVETLIRSADKSGGSRSPTLSSVVKRYALWPAPLHKRWGFLIDWTPRVGLKSCLRSWEAGFA
jgi:transcriptional antiterminator RfaH